MTNVANKNYEDCLLGSMILDPSVINDVMITVTSGAFVFGRNKQIFEVLTDLASHGQPIDMLTVSDKAHVEMKTLAALTDNLPFGFNAVAYAEKLNKMYMARETKKNLIAAAEQICDENVVEVVSQLDSNLNTITTQNTAVKPTSQKELVMRVMEMMQEAQKTKPELLGMKTGFNKLDSMLDGLPKGDQGDIVIAARPSIGKTSFASQIATGLASNGHKGAVFEFEMSSDALLMRELCIETGIAPYFIKHGLALETHSMMQRVQGGMQRLFDLPLEYYDVTNAKTDMTWIENKIRQLAKEGVEFFVVDHIGLIKHEDPKLPDYARISDISARFQKLCRKYNIAIIQLVQVNRVAEGERPTLAHLKGSGAIEENADIVMMLHRDRAQSPEDTVIKTDIIVAKNRNGSCGTIKFDFFPKFTKFSEAEEEKEAA
ncbi:MAG: hypothetical protein MJZ11_08510 [Lachnospiraceae bacterium]|nr:hypothetical protein [Lachnospiraceae bacterium]